jgi:hypothetical protein
LLSIDDVDRFFHPAGMEKIALCFYNPPLPKKGVAMEQEKTKDESRREFLIKAGKLAVYTPPALMLLMRPSKTVACTSAGGKRPPNHWDSASTFGNQGPKPGFGDRPRR